MSLVCPVTPPLLGLRGGLRSFHARSALYRGEASELLATVGAGSLIALASEVTAILIVVVWVCLACQSCVKKRCRLLPLSFYGFELGRAIFRRNIGFSHRETL